MSGPIRLKPLSHRKTNDLDVSLALLLHDLGKPLSSNVDGNRFNNHGPDWKQGSMVFFNKA